MYYRALLLDSVEELMQVACGYSIIEFEQYTEMPQRNRDQRERACYTDVWLTFRHFTTVQETALTYYVSFRYRQREVLAT